MCSRATCPSCKRPTFKGCGAHVEQVLADVPQADRCHCAEDRRVKKPASTKRSWFGSRT